jgi:hypothetical protein
MPFSCFPAGARGGDASAAPPSSSATSVYWTHLGGITLTWSRAPIGLLLAAELRLAGDDEHDGDTAPARFAFRPWLPWRRRGSKRYSAPGGRAVKFSWDLSRARFAATGRRPEPVSRYSLQVSVDGELALAVGDHAPPLASSAGLLLSRRENAVADDGRGEAYSTTVSVAGERHDVSLAVEGSTMWVAIDGEKALQVRRLRWKFRGSERLDLPSGRRIRVTWDLHGWLFCPDAAAVFVLRFETSVADDKDDVDDDDDGASPHVLRQGSFSFRNHHQAHGGGGGGGESWYSSDSDRRGWRRGPFRSGSDTSPSVSVASTSAVSSAGSVATVSEWAAAEEAAALKDGGGFSLVVQLWKKRR